MSSELDIVQFLPLKTYADSGPARLAAMALAAIASVLILTFPGWYEEVDDQGSERDVKPFPRRSLLSLAVACTFVAAVLGVISSLWQHIASVAVTSTFQNFASTSVSCEVGLVATALGWTAAGILMIPPIFMYCLRSSIRLLDKLTDDD